ncbi:hypothetical protein NLI96_g7235 [Meripilus lineatus]|uniref:Uncharacterized protein n=1 Tax=Meripilus lineatus TaxID=2056292 RepID=A0AAD5V1A5_9APHY|nr:hypothetical protein NLI96_g7235 [Physisporinus lineatus]
MTAVLYNMPPNEIQRQRYSRELAAYTYRQWETARKAIELASESPGEQPIKSPEVDETKQQRITKGWRILPSKSYLLRSCGQPGDGGKATDVEMA